jgi:hypothetical protein
MTHSSTDPNPETLFWHSFWHIIWKYIWQYIWHIYSDILSEFFHILWHSIWHSIWHPLYPDTFSGILLGVWGPAVPTCAHWDPALAVEIRLGRRRRTRRKQVWKNLEILTWQGKYGTAQRDFFPFVHVGWGWWISWRDAAGKFWISMLVNMWVNMWVNMVTYHTFTQFLRLGLSFKMNT